MYILNISQLYNRACPTVHATTTSSTIATIIAISNAIKLLAIVCVVTDTGEFSEYVAPVLAVDTVPILTYRLFPCLTHYNL